MKILALIFLGLVTLFSIYLVVFTAYVLIRIAFDEKKWKDEATAKKTYK